MSAGLEGLTLSEWITGTLLADEDLTDLLGGEELAAMRVVEGALTEDQPTTHPDTGAPLPWVTFTILEPQDVSVVGLIQVMARVEFQVRVTTPGASYDPAAPVYARAHALLHGRTNAATTDGLVLTCERIAGQQFPERANGLEFRHLGGLYRTFAQ